MCLDAHLVFLPTFKWIFIKLLGALLFHNSKPNLSSILIPIRIITLTPCNEKSEEAEGRSDWRLGIRIETENSQVQFMIQRSHWHDLAIT